MLRYVVFPTVSDIKINGTHFPKGVGVVYMASRQEIIFFHLAVIKFIQIYFFFVGAPPDPSPSISTTDGRFNLPRLLLAQKSTAQLGCRLPG